MHLMIKISVKFLPLSTVLIKKDTLMIFATVAKSIMLQIAVALEAN